jgi:type I restriction enzyme, R subunit
MPDATAASTTLRARSFAPLCRCRNSIADAVADLGRPEEISKVFVGFQKYLYQPGA